MKTQFTERSERKFVCLNLTLDIEDVKDLIRIVTYVHSLRSFHKSRAH